MKIPDTVTYAWAVPFFSFLLFWMSERCFSFFALTEDGMSEMNDWVFNLNYNNGTAWQDSSNVLRGFFSFFYKADLRYYALRAHILLAAITGCIVVLNLSFGKELVMERRRTGKSHPYAAIHKKLGWVSAYIMMVNLLATGIIIFITGFVPGTPTAIKVVDTSAWFIVAATLPAGIYFAKQKNWKRHRMCMIWFSGGLFVVPAQRLYWFVGAKLLYTAESFGGDPGAFFMWLVDLTWAGMASSLGVAAVYAYSDSLGTEAATTATKKKGE